MDILQDTIKDYIELIKQAQNGDENAKGQLVSMNSPLIKSVIRRYRNKGVDYDDLYQLGSLGFVKAINKYDASYNVKFTTYAVPLIAGEIKRFLRDDGAIKVSRSVKSLYVKIKRFLATKAGEEIQPTVDEIATEMEVTREDVIYAMEASNMPLSLFAASDEDGLSIADRLSQTEPIDLTDKIMLKNLLASLDEKERKIIMLRYFRNQTQTQVAKHLGISQVQVSRVEQKVLLQFREAFAVGEGQN